MLETQILYTTRRLWSVPASSVHAISRANSLTCTDKHVCTNGAALFVACSVRALIATWSLYWKMAIRTTERVGAKLVIPESDSRVICDTRL